LEILTFSFGATMPIVLCMALGLFCRYRGLLEIEMAEKLGTFCFQVLLPGLIFYNIYNIDFATEFSPPLMLFAVTAHVVLIAVLCLILFPACKDRAKAAGFVHLCYRSNYSMIGIALVTNMFGSGGARIAFMLIPVTLILFNVAAVVLFSFAQVGPGGPPGAQAREICVNVLTNPLIVSSVVATLLSLSPLSLPGVLYDTSRSLALMAIPFCLIVIGAQINVQALRDNARVVVWLSCVRLVAVPLVMLPIAVAFGFRGAELAALFAVYASPAAAASAIMAQKYNIYPEIAMQVLTATTIFGGPTVFVGIAVMRYFQLF